MLVSCTVNADLGGASGDASIPEVVTAPDSTTVESGAALGSIEAGACSPIGSTCIDDLSKIGSADFRITLKVTTTQGQKEALVNQRDHCGFGMFWDVRIFGGQILVETDDEMRSSDPSAHPLTELSGTKRVDDGQPHCVMIWRKSQTITIFVDGAAAGSASSTSSFGQLSSRVSETDPCDGQGCSQVPLFGSQCKDNTLPFAGTLSDLCLESP
jgi:hypothetical protein